MSEEIAERITCLDFTKPPPGFTGPTGDRLNGWCMRGPRYLSTFRKSPEEANAHGWSAYKARHDPPGLSFVDTEGEDGEARFTLTHDPRLSADPSVIEALRSLPVSNVCWVDVGSAMFDTEADARAAAWAWYERRLAAARRVEDDPRYRIDFCGNCGWENPPQVEDECLECGSTSCLITTWGESQAERYRSGERYTTPEGERDQDEGAHLWPRCLTWSDDQVAVVERWLADPTAEMPEVLADEADDEGPHVCTGCIGDGPCELEVGVLAEFCDGCGAARDEACIASCPWKRDGELGGEG